MLYYKEPKSKKQIVEGGGGVGWGGVDASKDEKAQTNLLLQLLRSLGHNNA